MCSAKDSMNTAFSPQHSHFTGGLPIFPEWHCTGIGFLMAAGVARSQSHVLFSLACVVSWAEEQKPSSTSVSFALSSQLLPFVTACLLWRGGNASPGKACSHTFSSPDSAGKQWPSQALPRTELCGSVLRPGAGTKDVCSGEQCRCNTCPSCWSSRESCHRWGSLRTQPWSCVKAWVCVHTGPPHLWVPMSLWCLWRSSASVRMYSFSITWAMQQPSKLKLGGNSVWHVEQPYYQPA